MSVIASFQKCPRCRSVTVSIRFVGRLRSGVLGDSYRILSCAVMWSGFRDTHTAWRILIMDGVCKH